MSNCQDWKPSLLILVISVITTCVVGSDINFDQSRYYCSPQSEKNQELRSGYYNNPVEPEEKERKDREG